MMRLSGAQLGDVEIRSEVLRQLGSDSRLAGVEIGLRVEDGTITLSGNVAAYDQALAAIEAASRADGGCEVRSEIQVTAPNTGPRADAALASTVRLALAWDAQIPHRQIEVAASNGWIALHGRVELWRERENAGRLVARIEGVRGVYNLIEVGPSSDSAQNVRDLIEETLCRRARTEADAIEVSLRGGIVSLSGRVHTWAEKQAILGALTHAPGIERVEDGLNLDPYY